MASKKKAPKRLNNKQKAALQADVALKAKTRQIEIEMVQRLNLLKRYREQLLGEIRRERFRQIHIFGGGDAAAAAALDDTKTPDDWYKVISDYNGIARNSAWFSLRKSHKRMIQIAAIALAAAESLTRRIHASGRNIDHDGRPLETDEDTWGNQ